MMMRLPYYLHHYSAQTAMPATGGTWLFVGLACVYGGVALAVLAYGQ